MTVMVDRTTVTSRDGTPIAFETSGSGPAIVLVGSALADRTDAKRLARHLSSEFTVVNYDRRGRGASGDTPPYSPRREIEDIEALITATGGSAAIFGSSSGAVLALDAAQALGSAVTGLVLFEPPFIIDASRPPVTPTERAELAERVASGKRGDAVKTFMVDQLGMPRPMVAVMRLLPSWSKLTSMAHTLVYDGTIIEGLQVGDPLPPDRWSEVDAPTLVVTGGKSEPFFAVGADALARLLPNARHEVLPGANHGAVVAAPKRVAAVVRTFVSTLP